MRLQQHEVIYIFDWTKQQGSRHIDCRGEYMLEMASSIPVENRIYDTETKILKEGWDRLDVEITAEKALKQSGWTNLKLYQSRRKDNRLIAIQGDEE